MGKNNSRSYRICRNICVGFVYHYVLSGRGDGGNSANSNTGDWVVHGTGDDRGDSGVGGRNSGWLLLLLLLLSVHRWWDGIVGNRSARPRFGDGGVVREGAVALRASEVAACGARSSGNVLAASHAGRLGGRGAHSHGPNLRDGILLNRLRGLLLRRLLLLLLLLLDGDDLLLLVDRNIHVGVAVDLRGQAKVGALAGVVETVVKDVGRRQIRRWHGAEGANDGSVDRNAFLADHLAEADVHVHIHQNALSRVGGGGGGGAGFHLLACVAPKVFVGRPGHRVEGSEEESRDCCADHHLAIRFVLFV